MNKLTKGAKPLQAPTPLTQEQQAAMVGRAFTQKFNSIAEGILFNLVHGAASSGNLPAPSVIVDQVLTITETYMEEVGPACDNAFECIFNKKEEETKKED